MTVLFRERWPKNI